LAISRRVPNRPSGASASHVALVASGSFSSSRNEVVNGVSTIPGHTAFARIRRGASSSARARVNWSRPPFCRCVGRVVGPSDERVHGSHGHNRAPVSHHLAHSTAYPECSRQIDLQQTLPLLGRGLGYRRGVREIDACVVREYVDTPEALRNRLDRCFYARLICDVDCECERSNTRDCFDFPRDLLDVRRRLRGNDDGCALFSKSYAHGSTDSVAASGNERDFSRDPTHAGGGVVRPSLLRLGARASRGMKRGSR
jgi:hypothetical protein